MAIVDSVPAAVSIWRKRALRELATRSMSVPASDWLTAIQRGSCPTYHPAHLFEPFGVEGEHCVFLAEGDVELIEVGRQDHIEGLGADVHAVGLDELTIHDIQPNELAFAAKGDPEGVSGADDARGLGAEVHRGAELAGMGEHGHVALVAIDREDQLTVGGLRDRARHPAGSRDGVGLSFPCRRSDAVLHIDVELDEVVAGDRDARWIEVRGAYLEVVGVGDVVWRG